MKKGPFTEEEDEIIILCLKKATSPNISHVIRKASTLLGRSFSSVYQRYLTRNKFDTGMLKKEKQDFEDWKIIHTFFYGEEEYIKDCVTPYNYSNLFKKDWEAMMEVVNKIEKSEEYNVSINNGWTSISSMEYKNTVVISSIEGYSKLSNTYYACVEFIKWFNKRKKWEIKHIG